MYMFEVAGRQSISISNSAARRTQTARKCSVNATQSGKGGCQIGTIWLGRVPNLAIQVGMARPFMVAKCTLAFHVLQPI